MEQAREAAYESMIVPIQRLLAAELQTLVPDFGDPRRLKIGFDLSQVRVLQEDQNPLFERLNATLWMTVDGKRAAAGLEPLDGEAGRVLLLPINTIPTRPPGWVVPGPDQLPSRLASRTPSSACASLS
jgi:hypothetical protein